MCKVVQERAYSVAWHPAESKLLLATGDKVRVDVPSVATMTVCVILVLLFFRIRRSLS